jgi:hypothetical protein
MTEVNLAPNRAEARPSDPLLREPIVEWMANDIGIDLVEYEDETLAYIDAVKGIESSGGWNTTGPADPVTGNRALGDYQWFPNPFKEDLEAARLYYGPRKADLVEPDWIEEALEHKDPRKLTAKQQEELFMIRVYRLADNEDIKKTYEGDNEKGRYIYETYHHTNVDQDTLDRMDEYLPLTRAPESESNLMSDLLSFQDQAMEPTPAGPIEPQPSLAGTNFGIEDRRRQGMMAGLGVDMPTTERVTVPQPSLGGTNFGLEDARARTRQRQMDSLQEVTPTQRGQVPIPQKRQPPPAPTAPLRPESQPNLEAMLASQQDQAMNPSVRPPQPAPEPVLEEIVPTQRGQVPIPQRPPVQPERVVGSEPRLESELASQIGMQQEAEKPLPPELKEIDLSSLPTIVDTYERTETPALVEDRRAKIRASIPQAPTESELRQKIRASIPASTGVSSDPDKRTGAERRYDRSRDTILTGATLGAYDEVSGFLNQAFAGTPYDETVNQIRKNVAEQRLMNPTLAGFQEIIPGIVTGGGIASQLVKRGVGLATAGGAEGAFTGAMYGETPMERAGQAILLGTTSATLGAAFAWATRPSSKATSPTVNGGRTAADDLADDQIFDNIIDQTIEDGATVQYRTNNGTLKTVSIERVLDNGNVQIKDGANVYAVPKAKIEKVNVGKTAEGAMLEAEDVGQFIDPDSPFYVVPSRNKSKGEFDWYKQGEHVYSLDVNQQLRMLADDYDGKLNIDAQAKRFSYIDEKPYTKGRKADFEETSWRDAQTAGEFFDGIKDLIKRFYNDKLVGASDYIMKLSPEVGAKFQRFTETALRNNTMSFETVIAPIEKMIKGLDQEDKMLKAMIMDYTNTANLVSRKYPNVSPEEYALRLEAAVAKNERGVITHIAEKYGTEEAGAFLRYLQWNKAMKGIHAKYINGERVLQGSPVAHIHTQLTPEVKATKFGKKNREFRDDFEVTDDSAKEFRSRPSVVDDLKNGGTLVDDYLNPILTDFRRTANYENLHQMARVFDLPEAVVEQQPFKMFETLRRHLVERGVSEKDAKIMQDIIRDDFVGQSRSPANWIQFLNSWGYAGSLAGPKSALLNLHDIPMAAVLYGPSSFKGVFKKMGYKVEDKGIRQNVGEFMNYMQEQLNSGPASLSKQLADTSRKGTDLLMRGSGFAWMDGVGKNAITRMIVQDAVDNVDKLRNRWGFYFSESELQLIEKQIRKHGTDVGSMTGKGGQLFEELFFAGLGQQQLISSAGRPAAWSRNPNFRFAWALRGFAIKQLALAQRNIFDNIAKGNKKEAWEYMQRYALFSAGGFGLLNESRQWIWGDGNFTAGGILTGFADQIVSTASINTIGLNDYQWGKMMEDGIVITWLRSLVPISVDIPLDTIGDIADAIDSPDKGFQTPFTEFPIINQWSNFGQNVEDKTGLVPNPMDQFNRAFIQQEKAE